MITRDIIFATTFGFPVYRPCPGPMPVSTSAHGSTDTTGCLAALGTRVWREKCKFAECIVRPRAPCRQSLFERPAGGVLQVPERQKKDRQFGGFAYPKTTAQPFSPRLGFAGQAKPRKGFLNRRFKPAFACFSRVRKAGPGADSPRAFEQKQAEAARRAAENPLLTDT